MAENRSVLNLRTRAYFCKYFILFDKRNTGNVYLPVQEEGSWVCKDLWKIKNVSKE
ncbi:MAG: hypothetical protein OXB93_00745 [Cytophagales bacterium]|nr:hypothetical protein [Cytophagales bacterium]